MTWFRQNQQILDEEGEDRTKEKKELMEMRNKLKLAEADQKRLKDLEKSNKLLEDTLKAKNPNSV